MDGLVSEYEQRRNQNMKENKKMLDKIMVNFSGYKVKKARQPKPKDPNVWREKGDSKWTCSDTEDDDDDDDDNDCNNNAVKSSWPARCPARHCRSLPPPRMTRARSLALSLASSAPNSPATTGKRSLGSNKLVVKIGSRGPSHEASERFDDNGEPLFEFFDDDESDDAESVELEGSEPAEKVKRRKTSPKNNISFALKDVKDVTIEDLDNVAEGTAYKVYHTTMGTTCHQCRQKTLDTKTTCRGDGCFGVRGQFCGPCLKNRYGESVRDALLDEDWVCPPCRNICNCSFCRRKKGKSSTGILIHTARESGYGNVKDFLQGNK